MENIYKVYSLYLYDNQLEHDYLILHNRLAAYYGISTEMPYNITRVLREIYNNSENSVEKMRNACEREGFVFLKNDEFMKPIFRKPTTDPRYSIYDIYWNETKSGIALDKYELCSIWKEGGSSMSTYLLYTNNPNHVR